MNKVKVKKIIGEYKTLIYLFLLAFVLRIFGIWHGLPDVYSVDEPALLNSIFGLRFDPNPHHFDWPHFHFYLSFLFFGIFYKARIGWQLWGWKDFLERLYPILWQDPAPYYLVIRSLNASMGALTVIPVYLTAKKLFNKKIAILSSIIFALAPFHVSNSHFATIDVPSAFWAAWVMYFSARILKAGRLKDYIFAGIFLGLGASTKYHAGFYALLIAVSHYFYNRKNIWNNLYKLFVSGIISIVFFFLGTPYALLDWETFSRTDSSIGAFWQFTRQGTRLHYKTIFRLLNHMFVTFGKSIGFLAAFLAAYGAREAFFRKSKELLSVSIFAIAFFLYIGSSEFSPIRIFTVFIPTLSILAAIGFYAFVERRGFKRGVVSSLLIVILIIPILTDVKNILGFSLKDSRAQAKDWVTENLPDGARIARKGEYLPDLIPKGEEDPYKGFYEVGVSKFSYEEFDRKGGVDYAWYGDFDFTEDMIRAKGQEYRNVLDNSRLLKKFGSFLRSGPDIFVYKIGNP